MQVACRTDNKYFFHSQAIGLLQGLQNRREHRLIASGSIDGFTALCKNRNREKMIIS